MSLHVVAHIPAKLDQAEQVREILRGLIGPTRRESGCISYELFLNNADPSDFTFIEEWENEAALDAHLQTDHIRAGLTQLDGLLAGPPDIRRYSLLA